MLCKNILGFMTVDVEEWFHILDDPGVPDISHWPHLETRLVDNMEKLLGILSEHKVKATMFWLGWVAERYPDLVRRCMDDGHEIACHGYAHVLPYMVGRELFRKDIRLGKNILEDITGLKVVGFRAAGFGITSNTQWLFEEIKDAGYLYDSSVFPAKRGHGGIANYCIEPHEITTSKGPLIEIPQSVVQVLGQRLSLFGGGYLRLAPKKLINWGINRLKKANRPIVIYIHPREVDPKHPRLPLRLHRQFKSYVNLRSTIPKLNWLCSNFKFNLMRDAL